MHNVSLSGILEKTEERVGDEVTEVPGGGYTEALKGRV